MFRCSLRVMGGPEGKGIFEVLDIPLEFLGLANPDGEGQGVTGGAEAEGLIRVVHGFGQDGDATEHEALEFPAGELGGLLAEAGQFGAEAIVIEPAAQSSLVES